jgi:hypothetical protein
MKLKYAINVLIVYITDPTELLKRTMHSEMRHI